MPQKKFYTTEEIKGCIFENIEKRYNRESILVKIGYLTPVEFEEMSKKNHIKSAPNIWVRTKR